MPVAEVLQVLHVISAFWFVTGLIGGDVVLGVARRSDDLDRVQALLDVPDPFERRMVIPGSIAVLVLGIITWFAQQLPLWGLGVPWLPVSLVMFVTTLPLVPLIFLPRGKTFAAALASAIEAGRVTPELSAAFDDPVVAAARWYELGIVALIVFLMVAKPF